jgi:hypothetical protein
LRKPGKTKVDKIKYNHYDTFKISRGNLPWLTTNNCLKAALETTMDESKKETRTVEGDFTCSLNHSRNYFRQVITSGCVPSVDSFMSYYWEQNEKALIIKHQKYYKNLTPKEFRRGVKARCYRASLGFLTELHTFTLAESFFPNYNIYKSIGMDSAGIDWVIDSPEETFAVRFYVDTPRAKSFAAGKLKTFNKNKPLSIINLTYKLDGDNEDRLSNGFVVCTDYHMNKLKNVIDGKVIPDVSLTFYSV